MPERIHKKRLFAFFLCIINAIIFCFHFFAAKDILKVVHPLNFAATRGIMGGLILIVIFRKQVFKNLNKKNLRDIAIVGFLGFFINQIFFMYGLKESTPLNASIIMNTIPIASTLMAIVFALEIFTWRKVSGILLGFLLILIVALQGKSDGISTKWGDAMIFLNVISFCLAMTIGKKIINKKLPPILLSSGMIFLGGLMLFIFSFQHTPSFFQYTFASTKNFWIMFFEVVISTSVAYYINFKALQILVPSQTMVFIYIQPPLTAFIEYCIWGKVPHLIIVPIIFGIMISGYLVIKRSKHEIAHEKNFTRP